MIGRTVAHYRVTAKLGEGGMGEVYRAEDSKLGRDVAIKVLPEAVATDPERLARFEREAKVLASLNHSNIASIYSIESADSVHFLVMELAGGEDLAERLARGAIPIDEANPIARQIAEALEVAHERGIIHRDLKPANVKVTSEGEVKVLDFGLAKALDTGQSGENPQAMSMSPTLTAQMTQAGVLLGTAAYMSPEQAKGLEADRRADVWAFGVVLWEMLTGKRLFEGDSVSDTLAAVLRDELDGATLPGDTPQPIRALLARCLDRDPKSRLRDIGEARVALDALSADVDSSTLLSAVGMAPAGRAEETSASKLPWLIAAVATLVAAGLALMTLTREEPGAPLIESAILEPEGRYFDLGAGLAISPDAAVVAFVAIDETGVGHLWVRDLETSLARPLSDTEGATYPFWSPDSRHIAFFADGSMLRISVAGGPVQTIARVGDARGGSWSEGGQIVYAPDYRGGLKSVSASGGEPTELTQVDLERGESAHRFPVFLPDGEHLLFLSQTAEGGSQRDDSRIEWLSLATGNREEVVPANSSLAYSSSGHLLFWHDGSLVVAGFDAGKRALKGDAVPIANQISYTGNEFATFSTSQTGVLVYQTGSRQGASTRLEIVDLTGQPLAEPTPNDYHRELSLSRDGNRAAYRSTDNITLWVRDLVRGTTSRFTFEDGDHYRPVWSPDDKWIAYGTDRDRTGKFKIMRKLSSGAGAEEEILEMETPTNPWDWSPDGNLLSLDVQNPETDLDIAVYSFEDQSLEFLIQTPFPENEARFSPDGQWLAYLSTETGRFEVYLVPLRGVGSKFQVSTEGGLHPEWDPRGHRLFYMNLRTEIMMVDLSLGDNVEIGLPQKLFDVRHPLNSEYPFRIRPDGESFVINQTEQQMTSSHMTLVQNWERLLEID